MGYTVFYLSVIVLIPLSALFFKSFSLGWKFYNATTSSRVIARGYKLTFFN